MATERSTSFRFYHLNSFISNYLFFDIKEVKPQIVVIIFYSLLLIILRIFNKGKVIALSSNTIIILILLFVGAIIASLLNKRKYRSPLTFMLEWSPLFLITFIYRILSLLNEVLIYPRVNVVALYAWEKKLFSGIFGGEMPNSWLYRHFQCPFVDFIVGIIYITDLMVPVILIIYSYYKRDYYTAHYGLLILALIGFISVSIFAIFPTAPPWYIEHFGFTKPELYYAENYSWFLAAKLTNFDKLINYPFYYNFYRGQNRDFFAAFPSVHIAYGFAVILISFKHWKRKSLPFSITFWLLVFFSAVYSYHHYILDGIAGVLCATIASFVSKGLLKLSKKEKNN